MTPGVHVVLMALTLRPPTSADTSRPVANSVTTTSTAVANRDVSTLLVRLNEARRSRGLPTLVLDPRLCAIAERHVLDMLSRHYFGHDNPEGVSPFGRMAQAHYRYGWAGENLALDRDAEAAHRSLLASPEHRENMMQPHFARVGIAALPASDGELVVEDFSD